MIGGFDALFTVIVVDTNAVTVVVLMLLLNASCGAMLVI